MSSTIHFFPLIVCWAPSLLCSLYLLFNVQCSMSNVQWVHIVSVKMSLDIYLNFLLENSTNRQIQKSNINGKTEIYAILPTNPSAIFMFCKLFEWFIDLFHCFLFFCFAFPFSVSFLLCHKVWYSCVGWKIRLIKIVPMSSSPRFIQCPFNVQGPHFSVFYILTFFYLSSISIHHRFLAMVRIWQTIGSLWTINGHS